MSADDQDRLTFGEGPLGGPLPDPDLDADTPPRRNRAFVYIAVAMAGLILLGILGLVFVLTVWLPGRQQTQYAAATAEVQALTREAAAWTATPAPTATPLPPTSTATRAPTLTPVPTATSTKVVSKGDVTVQPTSTPTTAPGGDKTTPPAGLGSASVAAIGVGLAGLLLAVRKLRG
jgi:cytoskeletal protein RodZ